MEDKELLKFINGGRFVVIQVMSARGESNSSAWSSLEYGQKYIFDIDKGWKVITKDFYKNLLLNKDINVVKKLVAESRENWVKNYINLLKQIRVPTILLWFSKRLQDYKESYESVRKLYGEFPQFVNHKMIHEIIPYADHYVECITKRGSPQPFNKEVILYKKEGEVKKIQNINYPSPEMHEDAAESLELICSKLIQ